LPLHTFTKKKGESNGKKNARWKAQREEPKRVQLETSIERCKEVNPLIFEEEEEEEQDWEEEEEE